MADSHQSTVTVDRLFAPAPHGLINDPLISHAAFRLWCVLHRLAFVRLPPEMDRLCQEMQQDDRTPDRRSVYRWLTELESRGWLRWQRTPGKQSVNRFLVLSERGPVTPESQAAQPVTPESQPVTPESQPVIVGSQVREKRPLSARAKAPPLDHVDHEKGGGGGGAPATIDGLTALFARYDITQAEPLARLYCERWPDITVDQLTRLCERLSEPEAGSYAGARLYRKLKAGPYERQPRSPAPDRGDGSPVATRGKHGPTGGSDLHDPGWRERLIAQAESGEL